MTASVRNRASRNYKFVLFESNLFESDLHPVSGSAAAGLHTAVSDITSQARDKKIDLALNKSGQITFRVPLTSSSALQIVNYEQRRCIVLYADDASGNPVARWSGPIWNVELSTDGNTVNVTVVGWMELLNRRECRIPYTFTALDAGVIASRLLTTANNQIANSNVVPGTSSSGTNTQRTGVDAGATTAEDLLYGGGDFEQSSDINGISGPTAFNTSPSISSTWAVSGSSSAVAASTNKNLTGYIRVASRDTSTVIPAGVINGFRASPGVSYNVRGVLNMATATGNVLARTVMNWYDAAGALISQTTTSVGYTTSGIKQVSDFHVAPALTVYGVLYLLNATGVVGDLLAYWDAFSVSAAAVGVAPTPIQLGTIDSPGGPVTRTRTYPQGQKIGLAIEELSQIESGYDYEVALVPTTISAGVTTLLRKLNVKYSTIKGSLKGIGTDQTNTFFGHRWGPNNVRSVRETRDSSKLANRVNVRGSGMLSMAQDLTSIALRGLHEDTISVSDAGATPTTLLGYAGAEVVYRSAPVKIHNISPFPWDGENPSRIPRLWVDYGVGDICYLVADNGALQIGTTGSPQAIRIFGVSITIDMEGNERIESLQTTFS